MQSVIKKYGKGKALDMIVNGVPYRKFADDARAREGLQLFLQKSLTRYQVFAEGSMVSVEKSFIPLAGILFENQKMVLLDLRDEGDRCNKTLSILSELFPLVVRYAELIEHVHEEYHAVKGPKSYKSSQDAEKKSFKHSVDDSSFEWV